MSGEQTRSVVEQVTAEKAFVTEYFYTENAYFCGATAPKAAPTPRHTPPRNLPPRNGKFVGRKTELKEIRKRLTSQRVLGVAQQMAAHGHGGVGKTSVALEYAWSFLDQYPGGAFFLDVEGVLPTTALAGLAEELGIPEAERPEVTALRVKTQLETGDPSLLILDNVRDADRFKDAGWTRWLPGENCHRLMTTRDPRLLGADQMLLVERLPTGDGIKLLVKYRPDAGNRRNRKTVTALVGWFDGWAIGLTVAGIYMQLHPDVSWPAFAESLSRKGLGAVRVAEADVGSVPDYDRRVDSVFEDLHASLSEAGRRALEYAALLPEDHVVEAWLVSLLEADPELTLRDLPGYDGHPARAVVAELRVRQLLVARGEAEAWLSLHRVLRRKLQEMVTSRPDLWERLWAAVEQVAESRGQVSHGAITDRVLRAELTPLLRLAEELQRQGRFQAGLNLANWVHTPLRDFGRFLEGRASLERFIKDAPPDWGDSPEAAIALSNLGPTLQSLGDLPGARAQMEQAIAIDEKHLDPDHPTLAVRYSNLALMLRDLGDLPGARAMIERAVAIGEKRLDPDHPDLATWYNNLGHMALAEGRRDEACRLFLRSRAMLRKHFTADHPLVRNVLRTIAQVCPSAPE